MKNFFWCLLAIVVFAALGYSVQASHAAPSFTAPQIAAQGSSTITCASNDGRRNICPADTRNGVQLVNQRSGSPCTFGRTWGYDARSIWVDRGCRADFQVVRHCACQPGRCCVGRHSKRR